MSGPDKDVATPVSKSLPLSVPQLYYVNTVDVWESQIQHTHFAMFHDKARISTAAVSISCPYPEPVQIIHRANKALRGPTARPIVGGAPESPAGHRRRPGDTTAALSSRMPCSSGPVTARPSRSHGTANSPRLTMAGQLLTERRHSGLHAGHYNSHSGQITRPICRQRPHTASHAARATSIVEMRNYRRWLCRRTTGRCRGIFFFIRVHVGLISQSIS